jgi:hypothetical protein
MWYALSAVVAVLVVAGFFAFGRGEQLLLAWYLRTVRKMDIPQRPQDAIKTYPLY